MEIAEKEAKFKRQSTKYSPTNPINIKTFYKKPIRFSKNKLMFGHL